MSIKKILIAASMSLMVLALAVPAVASALEVTEVEGESQVPANATLTFTGTAKFDSIGTGIECSEVDIPVSVEKGTKIRLPSFKITNPTTKCTFYGMAYSNCEFEEHPSWSEFPLVADLEGNVNEDWLTVTKNEGGGVGRINSELKSKDGKTCAFTTNDYTFVHEAGGASVKLDIETDANGFIKALILTGSVKRDTAAPGKGTTVTEEKNAGLTGTVELEKTEQGRFKVK